MTEGTRDKEAGEGERETLRTVVMETAAEFGVTANSIVCSAAYQPISYAVLAAVLIARRKARLPYARMSEMMGRPHGSVCGIYTRAEARFLDDAEFRARVCRIERRLSNRSGSARMAVSALEIAARTAGVTIDQLIADGGQEAADARAIAADLLRSDLRMDPAELAAMLSKTQATVQHVFLRLAERMNSSSFRLRLVRAKMALAARLGRGRIIRRKPKSTGPCAERACVWPAVRGGYCGWHWELRYGYVGEEADSGFKLFRQAVPGGSRAVLASETQGRAGWMTGNGG